jgi:release factor glutamine methyltransferase
VTEAAAVATIGAELDAAAARLGAAGIADPRREATALWAALTGRAAGAVWLARGAPAPDALTARFREGARRRSEGAPFAYAAGRAAFRGLDLAADPRALIPRPETEGLVDLILERCGGREIGPRGGWGVAADVGTGGGCLALALAAEGRFRRVIAVERSASAADLARDNVARLAPAVPVDVRLGDLLGPLAGERCSVIVSNPPYLTEGEYEALDPAVRAYEPAAALVSGPDGLAATRALLAGAADVLEPNGFLALEIDERRADAVRHLAHAAGWTRVAIHDDLFGRPRDARPTPTGGPDITGGTSD